MKYARKPDTGGRTGLGAGAMLVCAIIVLWAGSRAWGAQAPAFTVLGAQFHQRDSEDAGEARICLQNTGTDSLSMTRLKARVLVEKTTGAATATSACGCVYARLLPPVVRPGERGLMVVKLLERPAGDGRLTCDVSAADGTASAAVPLAEPALWVSYVGFSEDLRRTFVYVENLSEEPAEAQLFGVGPFDLAGRTRAIHFPLAPHDKGCLVGEFPSPVARGEFLTVTLATDSGERKSRIYTVARAIPAVPLVIEGRTGDPSLGLDAQSPFVETMACPAHAHGTHEAAAAQFLADYAQRCAGDPRQLIQMAICRNDMPRAWFRFGTLPDAAALNPCLRPPARYDKDPQQWPGPFFCVGALAKKATEPGRFLAIVPTGADNESEAFFHTQLTFPEWRFLVYGAVAAGAKGVIYRGLPVSDPLNRDAFVQLNRELQLLKPLWSIGEPVEWAGTAAGGYAARCLWCGDQALLVIVFDLRYFSRQKDDKFYTPSFGKTVVPVRVQVKIPAGPGVQEVRTPFAALAPADWEQRDGTLAFTADLIDSAQAYILSLQPPVRPWEGGPRP